MTLLYILTQEAADEMQQHARLAHPTVVQFEFKILNSHVVCKIPFCYWESQCELPISLNNGKVEEN